jgi:hypothetical protein
MAMMTRPNARINRFSVLYKNRVGENKPNDSKLHSFAGEKTGRIEALYHDKRQRNIDNQGGYQHDDAARQALPLSA